MERTDPVYRTCLGILRRELISAMGCTEPVALDFERNERMVRNLAPGEGETSAGL